MRVTHRKLLGISFLTIFLLTAIPLQYNFGTNPTIVNNTENKSEEPNASALNFIYFSVNGSELYEDGIYYCFIGDNLEFRLNTSNDVTSVNIDMHSPGYDFSAFSLPDSVISGGGLLWTNDGSDFSITNSVPTGMYNGTITISDGVYSDFFRFNISVMNPQPRIIKTQIEDLTYGASQTIFENEYYKLYKFSEINITCYALDDDGLDDIDSVKLLYENGFQDSFKEITLHKTKETTLNDRAVAEYALTTTIFISQTSESELAKTNWTIGNYFSFELIVNDLAAESESFSFQWEIYIGNQPPKITEFDVDGNVDDSTFTAANSLNFTIQVNATDLETDAIFGDNLYNISKRFNPSITTNGTSTVSDNNADPFNENFVKENDSTTQDISFSSPGGVYSFDFSISKTFDFSDDDLYKDWTFVITLKTPSVSVASLNLQIYNIVSGWETISSTQLQGLSADTVYSFNFLNDSTHNQNIGNYFNSTTLTNKLSARLVAVSAGSIEINELAMLFKVNRKVGFSDIYLDIYRPISENPISINMINLYNLDWDNSGNDNHWALNYSINIDNNKDQYRGVWSFKLSVYDFGTISYYDINPIEIQGENALSSFFGFVRNDVTRSYAITSQEILVGVDSWTDSTVHRLNQVSIDDVSPDQNSNSTVTVRLQDQLDSDDSLYFNTSYTPDALDFRVQDGEHWNLGLLNISTMGPTYATQVVNSNLELNNTAVGGSETAVDNMIVEDYVPWRFRINSPNNSFPVGFFNDSFAYIFKYNLDMKYWLDTENISGMWFDINQNFNHTTILSDNSKYPKNVSIQLWNFDDGRWITPNEELGTSQWHELDQSPSNQRLLKYDEHYDANVVRAHTTWHSDEWNDTTTIQQCIDKQNSNLIWLRVLVHMQGSPLTDAIQQSMNISIDYAKLNVEYNNTYQCKLNVWDSEENSLKTIEMHQTDLGSSDGYRTYQYEFPTSDISARNYHFSIWAQNGNSSIWYDEAQIESSRAKFGTPIDDFIWTPYFNSSLSIGQNYVIKAERSEIIFSTLNYATISNFHRHQETLVFNGTIDSRFSLDTFPTFEAQFRNWHSDNEEWITIDARNYESGLSELVYDNLTGQWNYSAVFGHSYNKDEWRSGVWYYRILTKSNETVINATDWGVFRIHNYQPKEIDFSGLESGSYYRVKDDVPYAISFVDTDGDDLDPDWNAGLYFEISISILVRNRDNNNEWEIWNSSTMAEYKNRINEEWRYFFEGDLNFGREIDIGNYSDVYIQVKDWDIDWPQVGTLRFTDRDFEVLNNIPKINLFDTNSSINGLGTIESPDQIYRNNQLEVFWDFIDIDDYQDDLIPEYFNISALDNSGNPIVLDRNNSIAYYSLTDYWMDFIDIDRRNSTGIWEITANFHDPDGAELSGGDISFFVEILNNLPVLQNVKYEKLETGTIAYTANQTSFGMFRGNETIRITADLYDIEDTWISERDYAIKEVGFTLVNDYPQEMYGLPLEEYSLPEFDLNLVRNGSNGYYIGNNYVTTLYSPKLYEAISNPSINNGEKPVVLDDGNLAASLSDITAIDASYHKITYSRGSYDVYGGYYYISLENLEPLFDVHASNLNYNLSFDYQAVSGVIFQLELYDNVLNQWVVYGNLSSSSFTEKNFTISSNEIRNYVNEASGNVLELRIRPYYDIATPVELDIDHIGLYYSRIDENYYERWVGEFIIPISENFHAGELLLNITMLDNDNGLTGDTQNLLNIWNIRPKFESTIVVKVNSQVFTPNMDKNTDGILERQMIRFENDEFPIITIEFNASDADSENGLIKTIEFSASVTFKDATSPQNFVWQFNASEYKISDGFYRIVLSLDPTAENFIGHTNLENNFTRKVEIFNMARVSINDYDFDKCDQTKSAFSGTNSLDVSVIYEFIEIAGNDTGIPTIVWIVIVGVAGVAFGIYFYQRFISYKKYMSDE